LKTIVVFASGSGSNAEQIVSYFKAVEDVRVAKIYCNNPTAGVLDRALRLGVEARVFNSEALQHDILKELRELSPELIVLAGFLWKIPAAFVAAFPNKIINIHPALLPKYGGKGMYGKYVFEAIVAHNEPETGITIHYVNEHYDEGAIIFQAKTSVLPTDTAVEVAQKTHALEHLHFAPQIHQLLKNQ